MKERQTNLFSFQSGKAVGGMVPQEEERDKASSAALIPTVCNLCLTYKWVKF